MINNRQAGRRRGRGGNGQGGGNGPRPSGGQRDSGNRIDSRARGNANQLYEKYKNLASDAQRQGDRVNTEYYLQFADHYFRVLSETRSRFEEQNQQRRDRAENDARPFVGSFDTGFDGQDDDYADEGEPIRPGEQAFGGGDQPQRREARPREDRQQEGRQQEGRQRDDRSRDDRPQESRQREDRPQENRSQENRPQENRQRDDRPRGEQRRDEQSREQAARDHAPREDGEGFTRRPRRNRDEAAPAPVNAEAADAPAPVEAAAEMPAEAEAPRRRGRPRRERPVDEAPAAFDATLLPPSLGIARPAAAVDASEPSAEGEEKPRRRRVRAASAEVTPAE